MAISYSKTLPVPLKTFALRFIQERLFRAGVPMKSFEVFESNYSLSMLGVLEDGTEVSSMVLRDPSWGNGLLGSDPELLCCSLIARLPQECWTSCVWSPV